MVSDSLYAKIRRPAELLYAGDVLEDLP